MEAQLLPLTQVLEPNICFRIPIYQRRYNWNKEHCKQLFDDIIKIGKESKEKIHFLGAITYVKENNLLDIRKYSVIDGQQRFTTIMLLLCALKNIIPKDSTSVKTGQIDQLLFNLQHKGSDDYHKLILTEGDNQSFTNILNLKDTSDSNNIVNNFKYFQKRLVSEDYDIVWRGIKRLSAVNVIIDEKGYAQVIFESMNSTGLDLTETDMIKNFILMSYESSEQKEIYHDYWRPMEQLFEDPKQFSDFLIQYLMMRLGKSIPKRNIYANFKRYMENRNKKEEVKKMNKYSIYYANLIRIELHEKLDKVIKYIRDQDTSVADSLLLKIIGDYDDGNITQNEVETLFLLIDSYLLRTHVCDLSKDSNKLLPEVILKIDESNYVKSIEKIMMSKGGNRRFPRDIIFKDKLIQLSLYTNRTMCSYMLKRLEEYKNSTEMVKPKSIQIEHIMPQTLTPEWENHLGLNHENTHEKYLHTIGNLTLTGHNQDLSNKSFQTKREIYKNSNISITRNLQEYEKWDEDNIIARAKTLIEDAVKIWPCPKELDYPVNMIQALETDYLEGKETAELWYLLKNKILDTFKDIEFYMTSVYGGFRFLSKGNAICTIEAQKSKINLTYNTKIQDKIITPSDFVKDYTNIGHYGLGNFRSAIVSEEDIDKAMDLIKSVYEHK